MLTPYPESFPSDSVASLITMIREKTADKEAMGLAIWNLQGYAQSKLLKNNALRFTGSSNPDPSDEDVIEALNTLQLNKDNLDNDSEDPEYMQANPIMTIALSILLKWLLNRVSSM